MTATTANRGYPYPQGSDFLGDTAAHIQALAEDVDADVSAIAVGTRYARAAATAAQSIPNNAWTALTFADVEDPGAAMGSDGYTAPVAGLYLVTAGVGFAAATGGGNRILKLVESVSGSLIGRAGGTPHAVAAPEVCLVRLVRLAAGEKVSAHVFQDSGGALNTVYSAGNAGAFLEVFRVTA